MSWDFAAKYATEHYYISLEQFGIALFTITVRCPLMPM